MTMYSKRSSFSFVRRGSFTLAVSAVLIGSAVAGAQTFRGTVSGTVTDSSGAIVANAAVELKNPATGTVIQSKTNGAGSYSFPEIAPGKYELTVSAPGFATRKVSDIDVQVTKVATIDVPLSVGAESTIVDVAAGNTVAPDTESSALVTVVDNKAVAELPLNGRDFTRLVRYAPGVAALSNSVNGSRTASINFQVDGADNVDAWLGIVASNQGGIASVAGGLIPIEAIDQFSMQAGGAADQGRNAGANSNMVLKSGTNNLHGDVFYFDRNEFFAAISPVAPANSRKQFLRNHQGGFTLGGPIWKDKTFFFLAGEIQIAKINTALTDTVLTDSWVAGATSFMNAWRGGLATSPAVSQLSTNLYGLLFPANSKGGAATTSNYFAQGTTNYNSYNGIIKLDHHFGEKNTLSLRYLGTTGKQTAPTGSYYADYYQTAPMHIHNFSVVDNHIFSSKILNQLTLGVNYFLQTFNDANQNFFPQQNAGLNLGITNPIVAQGAPTINISSFDITGATQPSGRTDVTGHITDSLHWTLGRHQFVFGGEYRRADINQLYFSSSRGTFNFDGTRGPWFRAGNGTGTTGSTCNATSLAYAASLGFSTASACNNLAYIADFLAGQPTASSGAKLLQGNAQRVWLLNTEEFWAADTFKVNSKFTLNLGVRYSVPGVVHSQLDNTYSFRPANGNNAAGFYKPLYNNYYASVSPRIGFAYSPRENNATVIRGFVGRFYDTVAMSAFASGSTGNGGAAYSQNNPAGSAAAAIYINNAVSWQVGVNPFLGAAAPTVGAFGVDPNVKMPYADEFNLNIEQQVGSKTLLTIGYVGTLGRHLLTYFDLNQPLASGSSTYNARPYASQTSFVNENAAFVGGALQGINQLRGAATSNYNSLQVSVRQADWHGFSGNLNYTLSKFMDTTSSTATPMNSYNLKADYGPSANDGRNNVNGYVFYTVPQFFHALPRVTKGFQLNASFQYSSGLPLNPTVSTDNSRTYQLKDRPNVNVGVNPYTGLQLSSSTSSGRQYRWMQNGGAFTAAPVGTYGNERRDAYVGPNFRTVDFSLFKHTPITEKINTEFRAEVFNIFNFNNFANPSVSNISSSTFGLITNTRNGASAPGIGFGEPFNVQFAFKVTF